MLLHPRERAVILYRRPVLSLSLSLSSRSSLQHCMLFDRFSASTAAPSCASGALKVFADELSKHGPDVTQVRNCFLSVFFFSSMI